VGEAGYLKVETAHHGLVCVLAVTGELDLVTVPNLAESAAAALKTPAERFVLDLSRLTFIDCCGARALAAITRTVPPGCPVIVRSVSPAVRRVLDLMNVNLESRAMVPGNQAARLLLESQRIRSLAQQAMAESRALAETLAATEDRVADTLTRLADRRPHRAGPLAALSHTARTQAAQFRARARTTTSPVIWASSFNSPSDGLQPAPGPVRRRRIAAQPACVRQRTCEGSRAGTSTGLFTR
jgi:anti-anti-sigma factor